MFADDEQANLYLRQEVMSASPARLRWMLIRRADELCGVVEHLWNSEQYEQAEQWLLKLRDVLGELLNGVTDATNPLGKTIADFYVFLLQLVNEVQANRDRERLTTLRELLGIELDTWRMVVENQGDAETSTTPTESPSVGMPHVASDNPLGGGTLSLEI